MTYDWRNDLYTHYVTSGQGGAGAESSFARQLPLYNHWIRRLMPTNRQASVLDVGCGAGGLLFALKKKGYLNVAGVDVSAEMIALAKSAGVSEASEGDMIQRLKTSADASHDVVFAIDILEHLTRPELFEIIHNIFRVLRGGGRLIAHVPNAAGIFGGAVRYGDLTHELAFTDVSIRQLMRVIGFEATTCLEDRPLPHGLLSLLRAVAWPLLSLPYRLLNAVETGRLRGAVLSRNMTVVCFKPLKAG